MNAALLKALIVLVPAVLLLLGSVILSLGAQALASLLQLLGIQVSIAAPRRLTAMHGSSIVCGWPVNSWKL